MKGVLLGGANIAGALMSLVRNIIIARLLAAEDFGIASTFAITFALIEMLSDLGVNTLIVQARDGNRPTFQASLHSIQLVRGLFGGLVLFLLAGPYALVLGAEEAIWAFQALAIVPVLRGLWHLDIFRLQRKMRFRAFAITTVLSQVLAVLAIWPLAQLTLNYQIMLWSILIHQFSFTAATYFFAERRFRIAWDWAVVKRTLIFGVPLLGNSILLFGIFHGDRLIVANQLGLETLAWFAVAMTLTLTPSMVLAKTLQALSLPQLAKCQDDRKRFEEISVDTFEACIFVGTSMALCFALVGAPALILLFSAKYAAGLDILTWLAIMNAVRLMKAGPNIIATSKGETTNPLYANIARCLFLPVAFIALVEGAPILVLVWLAILGEAVAVLVSIALLRLRLDVSLREIIVPVAGATVMLTAIAIEAEMSKPLVTGALEVRIGQLILITGFLLFACTLPIVRKRATGFLHSILSGRL